MGKEIPKNPLVFGLYIARMHKKWSLSALFSVLIATALNRYPVVILGNLTNALSVTPISLDAIWRLALFYAGIFIVYEAFWRVSGFAGMYWFTNYRYSAHQMLYSYLARHSKDYFNNRFAGALGSKISNAVDGTETMFETLLWEFIPIFFGIIWYAIFISFSNIWLGFIIVGWSAFFVIVNFWFAKVLQPYSYKYAETLSHLRGNIVDSLSNISLVHEYAYVSGEQGYIKKFAKKEKEAGIKTWRLSEMILAANGVMLFIFIVLMLGTSIYLFQIKLVTVGVVIMSIAIVGDLSNQLLFLASQIKDFAKYFGEAREGLEEILSEHDIVDVPDAKELVLTSGEITVKDITFDYENTRVFQHFSLKIPTGQKIGIVGRSGAGKTTLVSLLLRHFDVKEGKIMIDEQNIAEINRESLRRTIAFVPQDTSLFHRSIADNIKYSNPDATQEQIETASKHALADEFIKKLPQGYETMVGERGIKLSGGQRQRIAIARAFLKNAPILILDEATSSLDSESESAIQSSLETLMKGRTVIAIAHRLSTLKEMDRLVVLQNGKIVEDGSFDDLLKNENGVFKKMWEHQVQGFILDD